MISIVQTDNSVLRETALPVPISDIAGEKIQSVLRDMKIALDSQEDGVAIAAPQIGVSMRIFVVSERAFDVSKNAGERRKIKKDITKKYGHLVFINPVITKISKSKEVMEEGCLSVRYKYGKIERSDKATVEAYDENGKKFTRGGSGLLAQIFQHETDHLDGVLFIDNAFDVKDIPPEEWNKQETNNS